MIVVKFYQTDLDRRLDRAPVKTMTVHTAEKLKRLVAADDPYFLAFYQPALKGGARYESLSKALASFNCEASQIQKHRPRHTKVR